MEALAIAKKMAPSGEPDFELIINEGTQLSTWNKIHGQASTAKFIFLFLVSLNKYFNVVRPMSTEQMQELALDFSNYTVFKFEDFIAFFEGVKRQRFGQIRDRLDPATIWEMFHKYDNERDRFCENRAREKTMIAEHGEKGAREKTEDEKKAGKIESISGVLSNIKKQINHGMDTGAISSAPGKTSASNAKSEKK